MLQKGKYHQTQAVTVKPPINYEEERRRLSEELKEEYNQFRAKVKHWSLKCSSCVIHCTFNPLLHKYSF